MYFVRVVSLRLLYFIVVLFLVNQLLYANEIDIIQSCWKFGGQVLDQRLRNAAPSSANNSDIGKQFIFSPLSLFYTLSLASLAAKDKILRSMNSILYQRNDKAIQNIIQHQLLAQYGNVLDKLSRHGNNVQLANNIFPQRKQHIFVLDPEFEQKSRLYFGVDVIPVDYVNEPEEALKTINDWASQRTSGHIREPITDIAPNTNLIMLNAIYFDMSWNIKFSRTDIRDNFRLTRWRHCQYIRMIGFNIRYKEMYIRRLNANLYVLPYVNNSASMIIIVPKNPDNLRLHPRRFMGYIASGILSKIQLRWRTSISFTMPKFDIRNNLRLNQVLKDMGMKRMFTDSDAFSFFEGGENTLAISEVRQEAFVSVSEKGTKAAAISAISFSYRSYVNDEKRITIRQPFIYVIKDEISHAPLFVGTLLDPSVL